MPYRTTPPRQRPWWDKLTGVFFLGWVVVGLVGLIHPSTSVDELTTEIGTYIFSAFCVLLGGAGFRSWWVGSRKDEAIAMYGLAGLTLIHSLAILVAAGTPGLQTATRMSTAVLSLLAWIGTRQAFGMSRQQIKDAIVDAGESEALRPLSDKEDGE